MKHLWQYKHWPDEKNPDEVEPWREGPPNPCTVFRVKWLEHIRTWARYVSGEFSENMFVVPLPQEPDPVTTETVVQEASFWDFLTFSGEWAQRWDRYTDISGTPGVWAQSPVDLPEWEKFRVDDVLHPGAVAPNDVLMPRLTAFREYIEQIKAIEIHDHFLSSDHWTGYDSANFGAYGSVNGDLSPFAHFSHLENADGDFETNCYIHGFYWAPTDYSDMFYSTAFVREALGQRNYRSALLSEWASIWGVSLSPYNAWPKNALYCHQMFGRLPRNANNPWIAVNDIGRLTDLGGSSDGHEERLMRYLLLIDDDLPPELDPIGASVSWPR